MRSSVFFLCTLIVLACTTTTEEKQTSNNSENAVPPAPVIDHSKFLKEKDLLLYIPKAPIITPGKQLSTPFDTLNYNKVIAYDFEGSEEPYPSVIDERGKFIPVILKQQYLNQKQIDKIFLP